MEKTLSRHTSLPLVTAIVTLALWRWRRHWFLLLVTGGGMVTAVMMVCTLPLLTLVMHTAGLRSVLTASPASSELTLRATVVGLSTQTLGIVDRYAQPPIQDHLKGYLKGPPRLEIQTPDFTVSSPAQSTLNTPLRLDGNSIQQAAPHVILSQGRLPRTTSDNLEVALTPATAAALHVHVGDVVTVNSSFYTMPVAGDTTAIPYNQDLKLHVVGLFEAKAHDPFWHGEDFQPASIGPIEHYPALVSSQTLLAEFDRIAAQYIAGGVYFPSQSYAYLYWYYSLDPSRVLLDRLDQLIGQLAATQVDIAQANSIFRGEYQSVVQQFALSSPVLRNGLTSGSLENFRSRSAVAGIPLAILVLQITCLLLFFVSAMVELLVEHQADAIAFLRSRGASESQIFGAHAVQVLGLSLLALVAGPLLAYTAVHAIAQRLLTAADQDALNALPGTPVAAFLNVRWYILATVGVVIMVMVAALYRASHLHVLARREAAGTPWRPLWQRLNLDLVALVIALAGYAIAVYLTDIAGLLDARTQALVSAPVALIAPVFLLVAATLLLLRLLPWLWRTGSRLAARSRGAIPMLALAQLARSPRQSLRMIMLLAFATAFAMFTLVFAASQAQRAMDISAYQAGADFSGTIPSAAARSLKDEMKRYRTIPGVVAATVGYIGVKTAGASSALFPIEVRAVDPGTFAQATIWTPQDSSQPLTSLLADLAVRRSAAIHNGVIPAIVDAYMWNRLALHIGEAFSVHQSGLARDDIQYIAVTEVQHVPTLYSGSDVGANLLSGNLIVDYQTFAAVQKLRYGSNTPVNYVWLRTAGDAVAVAHVRQVLQTSHMQLDHLSDRRALIDAMHTDPFYLNLIVVVALGAVTALLFVLVGNMLTFGLSVRTRLTEFVVLRALGTTPRQVAGVLAWEQGLVYLIALCLGAGFGALLSLSVVPTLVVANTPVASALGGLRSDEFYLIQRVIPAQTVFPWWLGIAFAVLLGICAIAVGMMAYVTMRPAMSPLLRLAEDQAHLPYVREEPGMVRAVPKQTAPRRTRLSFVPLAFQQLRQTWAQLLLVSAAIAAAIMIACAIPLLSAVMTMADLRDTLNAVPQNRTITLDASTQGVSTQVVQRVQQQLDPPFQAHIGAYLSPPASLSILAPDFTYISPFPHGKAYFVNLFATSMEQAATHLTLLRGRLPYITGDVIEALLTPQTAGNLHVKLGSLITLRFESASPLQGTGGRVVAQATLNLRMVGLFTVTSVNDYAWHANTFQPVPLAQTSLSTLLIPTGALLMALDHIAARSHANAVSLPGTNELIWDYRLDSSRITYTQLADLANQLTILQEDIQNHYGNTQATSHASRYSYLLQASVYSPVYGSFVLLDTLERSLNRIDVFRIPAAIFVLQIVGLILLFLSLMADILVERQANAIALLRSRGASGGQIAACLVTQAAGLGVLALMAGPPLAVLVVALISRRILDPKHQDVIGIITSHPLQAALDGGWYAVATALILVIALSLLLRRAVRMNVLSHRRETARSSRGGLWRHLLFDGGAAIIALTAYGVSVYLTNLGNQLDIGTRTLVSTPLAVVAATSLIIGIMMLFLRFFPFLLRLGAWLTVRGRGAASTLALAQMARSPHAAACITLLLAFAFAFAIFTQVSGASQARHIADISGYEAGADFSGDIISHRSLLEETALYRAIAGVTSATVGFTAQGVGPGTVPVVPVHIVAPDVATFGRTAIWSSQDSSRPLASLLVQLAAQRDQAIMTLVVPAIIDQAAANELTLGVGAPFTVTVSGLPFTTLNYIVVAQVEHIPTINNNADAGSAGGEPSPAGILVDYTTYAAIYRAEIAQLQDRSLKANSVLPLNHVWLRTSDGTSAVAHVRAALKTRDLRLDNLYDRRALDDTLRTNPLFLNLMAFLTLGAITALLLASLGGLLASWLSVHTRLTNFAVLRALGATFRQVTSLLLWEQGIVYMTAFMLGGVFGAILSVVAAPALVFTNIPAAGVLSNLSNSEFYTLQQVVPPQIVFPSSLEIVFLVLLAIFIVAVAMMVWVSVQPSLGRALRLNED